MNTVQLYTHPPATNTVLPSTSLSNGRVFTRSNSIGGGLGVKRDGYYRPAPQSRYVLNYNNNKLKYQQQYGCPTDNNNRSIVNHRHSTVNHGRSTVNNGALRGIQGQGGSRYTSNRVSFYESDSYRYTYMPLPVTHSLHSRSRYKISNNNNNSANSSWTTTGFYPTARGLVPTARTGDDQRPQSSYPCLRKQSLGLRIQNHQPMGASLGVRGWLASINSSLSTGGNIVRRSTSSSLVMRPHVSTGTYVHSAARNPSLKNRQVHRMSVFSVGFPNQFESPAYNSRSPRPYF